MKEKTPTVVLVSGGIDSFVAYHMLKSRGFTDVRPVYFNLGTKYSEKEIGVVKKLYPEVTIDLSMDLADRERGEKAYIPFRNLLLACQAVQYADSVVIAGVKDDVVSDKNEAIFEEFSKLLSAMEGRRITVWSPLWSYTKAEAVEWWLQECDPSHKELIEDTVSCYSAGEIEYCGRCPSCFRKWCAFWENGIKYDFYNEELMREYLDAALKGKYIAERNQSIIKCVRERFTVVSHQNIIEVDLDGTLTEENKGHGWMIYKNRTPILSRIEILNKLYRNGHRINIRTSRYEEDRKVTEEWLEENGVLYDDLSFDKPRYTMKIDDKCYNADDPGTWELLEGAKEYEDRNKQPGAHSPHYEDHHEV